MLEFLLLGPLEVRRDGEAVPIRGERRRALLAALLLHAGRPVPTHVLIECVWGAEPPAGAEHSLHQAISKLRRTLDGLVESRSPGAYVAHARDEQVDARRFEQLAQAGFEADDPAERSRLLQAALELWRGPALVDVTLEGPAAEERDRLEELRLAATTERIDADLALGRNAALVPELEQLSASHPLHERFREQLMLALYREGRQADALREYRETRALLAEEVGLEPSERLRDLERAILRQDPALAASEPRSAAARSRPRRRLRFALVGIVVGVVTLALVLALGTGNSPSAVLFDSLRGSEIDTNVWDHETVGKDVAISPTPDGVRMTIGGHALPVDPGGVMKAHLITNCWLAGAFDVQVDYRLENWPPANGVSVGMYAAYANVLRESDARRGEQYVGSVAALPPPDGPPNRRLRTHDVSGTLRIVRAGDRLEERVRTGGRWRVLFAGATRYTSTANVYLEVWTNRERFAHREVDVEFSNFRVRSGELTTAAPAFAGSCHR